MRTTIRNNETVSAMKFVGLGMIMAGVLGMVVPG